VTAPAGVWSVDAEYGFGGGAEHESAFVPVVFCAVNALTAERHAFWGRDPRLAQFLRGHAADLFVSHNLIAEAKYLLRLGVTPPARWFDTMLAWRYVSNAEVAPQYGLEAALTQLGLPHAFAGEKDTLRERIGRLDFDAGDAAFRRTVHDYCFEDCEGAARLYWRLAARVPAAWMRYAAEFCLETARMELRGIGMDLRTYARLLERKAEVIRLVTGAVNAVSPVFTDSGSLVRGRFFSWCATNGVGWPLQLSPRTGEKYLAADKRAFERMKGRHPFVAAVHEANKTAKQLTDRKGLVVDPRTGRHHFGNIPFGMATGRTSFRGFLLSCPKWMRWLAVPKSPEHRLVSVDFEAEEIVIAAHLSGDRNMLAGYLSGDPHMAFAVLAGAAPAGASKATHPEVRRKYKAVNLGVNYGQTAYGLTESTGMHHVEAVALLGEHRRAFAAYWRWADGYTSQAFRSGRCWTAGAWPRAVDRRSNPRSVANYPVQGTGADLMRLAVVYLSRNGLPLLAVNHDGFLFECHRDQLPDLREAVDSALRQAVEQLLPRAPMRWSFEVFTDRYRDEEGRALWERVNGALRGKKRQPAHL
jgi:DNA polymerase I-like protein with 3'-5' exonuclease and polymerase domains